ncbi:MAG: hypothetical protein GAK30_02866 [Paracidovorax wautersii]|uniref:Uncharacterized protein n=1 Tax=Paracidovorax wautersii TaxID=1177982 RepID=A0A7V8FM89_9BURK|nr:MAG: hypothetical protein GAK30_02866 [Paracidovorax wautersii]
MPQALWLTLAFIALLGGLFFYSLARAASRSDEANDRLHPPAVKPESPEPM